MDGHWSLVLDDIICVPGMTSRRRTRAALALEDAKGALEEGVKVVSGERRSHEASEAGSWPRVELLRHSDTRSCDLLPRVTCGDQWRF